MAPLPHRATELDAARVAATKQYVEQLERGRAETSQLHTQLRRIERVLERLLASPALTRTQREELLGLLAGTRGTPATVPAANPPAEQRLIEHYRVLDNNDKRLISLLAARFAKRKR